MPTSRFMDLQQRAGAACLAKGTSQRQAAFPKAWGRVRQQVDLSTPNRWFLIECHIGAPLVNWLPPDVFRHVFCWLGEAFWGQDSKLNWLEESPVVARFSFIVPLHGQHGRRLRQSSNRLVHAQRSLQ